MASRTRHGISATAVTYPARPVPSGPSGGQALGEALAGGAGLVGLYMTYNEIGDSGAAALANALAASQTVTEVRPRARIGRGTE